MWCYLDAAKAIFAGVTALIWSAQTVGAQQAPNLPSNMPAIASVDPLTTESALGGEVKDANGRPIGMLVDILRVPNYGFPMAVLQGEMYSAPLVLLTNDFYIKDGTTFYSGTLENLKAVKITSIVTGSGISSKKFGMLSSNVGFLTPNPLIAQQLRAGAFDWSNSTNLVYGKTQDDIKGIWNQGISNFGKVKIN